MKKLEEKLEKNIKETNEEKAEQITRTLILMGLALLIGIIKMIPRYIISIIKKED